MKIPPENIILRFLFYSGVGLGFLFIAGVILVLTGKEPGNAGEMIALASAVFIPFWLGRTLYEIAKDEMKIIQQKS